MSKLSCACGNTIVDQTNNISYKAYFIRDQDCEEYDDSYMDDIDSFINAIRDGRRDEWIKKYFTETYPTDLSNSSIISDIISQKDTVFESDLYQCTNCGRVKVQVQDKNLFASFLPEDNNYKDIFKRFRDSRNAS
jgi:hypothetical protein